MTGREWKPGDVAIVTFRTDDEVLRSTRRGIRWRHGWIVSGEDGYEIIHDRHVLKVRPLVDIDPENRGQVERLTDALAQLIDSGSNYADGVQAALREIANPPPPKPDEPTDFRARVIDAEGEEWARRRDGRWACLHKVRHPRTWDELLDDFAPVEVTQ